MQSKTERVTLKKRLPQTFRQRTLKTSLREGGGTRDRDKESAYPRINRVTEGARRAVEKLWKDQICCFSRALSSLIPERGERHPLRQPLADTSPKGEAYWNSGIFSISADGMKGFPIARMPVSPTSSVAQSATSCLHDVLPPVTGKVPEVVRLGNRRNDFYPFLF